MRKSFGVINMIVEFLGVSGSGKTTVAKKLKSEWENAGIKVVWDTYELYANHGWLTRNLRKAGRIMAFSLSHPRWIVGIYSFIRHKIRKTDDFFIPLFNGIYLKSILDYAKTDSQIHIFDEGPLQWLWGIKLREKSEVKQEDVKKIYKMFDYRSRIYVIETDPSTIESRLLNRNKETRILEEENIRNAIVEMIKIQEQIVEFAREYSEILNIDNN